MINPDPRGSTTGQPHHSKHRSMGYNFYRPPHSPLTNRQAPPPQRYCSISRREVGMYVSRGGQTQVVIAQPRRDFVRGSRRSVEDASIDLKVGPRGLHCTLVSHINGGDERRSPGNANPVESIDSVESWIRLNLWFTSSAGAQPAELAIRSSCCARAYPPVRLA